MSLASNSEHANGLSADYVIDIAGLSDVGVSRSENEDCIGWWYNNAFGIDFALLADGMGGYAGGARASQLCFEYIKASCIQQLACLPEHHEPDASELEALLRYAAHNANAVIRQQRQLSPGYEKMGSTLVMLAILDNTAIILSAGDSRCYHIPENACHPHELKQLTRDHSVAQAMLEKGLIEAADVAHVPYQHVLTKAVGIEEHLSCTAITQELADGDCLLLCSDGLYHAVDADAMLETLKEQPNAQSISQALLQHSLNQQTNDNTSVVAIKFHQVTPRNSA